MSNTTLNKRGQWVPAIPLPLYVMGRKRCRCGKSFWTTEGYRAHYALRHIIDPAEDAYLRRIYRKLTDQTRVEEES